MSKTIEEIEREQFDAWVSVRAVDAPSRLGACWAAWQAGRERLREDAYSPVHSDSVSEHEHRLDLLMTTSFTASAEPLHDYALLKIELKRLRAIERKLAGKAAQ